MVSDTLIQLHKLFYYSSIFKVIQLLKNCRLYLIWTGIFLAGFLYHIFYVPYVIGLDFELPNEYLALDIVCICLMLIDSFLRPFLAINS